MPTPSPSREEAYRQATDPEHRKALGQYFTPPAVAGFLAAWACRSAATVLDPAVGNSVLLRSARAAAPEARLTGYELDPGVLEFFGNPTGAVLHRGDYLLAGWQPRFDAIICNPPYRRFQDLPDRTRLLEEVRLHAGVRCSRYTNLCLLFLLKSLCQLTPRGRLAYLLPAEFLNARSGTAIKALLLERRLLRAVINFPHDRELFPEVTTTCCLLLADCAPKEAVGFYTLDSMAGLETLSPRQIDRGEAPVSVPYTALRAEEKWLPYLCPEPAAPYRNLTTVSRFCTVSRGIATGANAFFCFSRSRMEATGIPRDQFVPCICRSASVRTPLFTGADFEALAQQDRTVYLLDVKGEPGPALAAYLAAGVRDGIPRKYLPSIRHPWYAMEQKPPAPLWVTGASRGTIKCVRNLAGVRALTTFHLLYLRPPYTRFTDLLFAYLLTPVAQELLRRNRKTLGNGLQKFQPRDFSDAPLLDLRVVSPADQQQAEALAAALAHTPPEEILPRLNGIFTAYLDP